MNTYKLSSTSSQYTRRPLCVREEKKTPFGGCRIYRVGGKEGSAVEIFVSGGGVKHRSGSRAFSKEMYVMVHEQKN